MNKIEDLRAVANQALGGLKADTALKSRIYEAASGGRRARKPSVRMVVAFSCALVLIAVGVVGIIGNQNANKQLIHSQTAGGTLPSVALLDVPQGAITLGTRGSSAGGQGIWASGSGGNFPMIRVEGRTYRLLTNPTDLGQSLLGAKIGAVGTYTSEPATAQGGIVSNLALSGTTVYAVKGMDNAVVAAQIDGKTRAFQRVSFGGKARVGGESLRDTLKISKAERMEITGVGAITDSDKATELLNILYANAEYQSAGVSATGKNLLIQMSSGLVLQLTVKGEQVGACGMWACPEFFEAFQNAL